MAPDSENEAVFFKDFLHILSANMNMSVKKNPARMSEDFAHNFQKSNFQKNWKYNILSRI